MDLTAHIPEKNALYAGALDEIKLAYATKPFVLPTGKFVAALLPDDGRPPAFLLRDVQLTYGWHEKFRTLSIPAPPDSEARRLADRLGYLAKKAAGLHADTWFGKPASVVQAAVTVKDGLRDSPAGPMLTLKAPSAEDVPDFCRPDGAKIGADTDLRGATADLLVISNGLFVRGLDVFVQFKLLTLVKKTDGKPRSLSDVQGNLTAFTLVE